MSQQGNIMIDYEELFKFIWGVLRLGSGFQLNPRRTMADNIGRLIYGEVPPTSVDPRLFDEFLQTPQSVRIVAVARNISMFDIDSSLSPLKALQLQVHNIFSEGLETASHVCSRIQSAAVDNSHHIELDLMYKKHPPFDIEWRSCKLASTTVLLFATPKDRLFQALRFNSQSCGGLPTLDEIRSTPTSSFISEYSKGKLAAQGPLQRTTVMCVSLADVHIFELARVRKAERYSSFAHSFVAGIGPEGMVIWQAWGEHGYRLDEYLGRSGDRVRTWSEADAFVKDFESLVAKNRGPWNSKRNEWYKRCFEVDIQKICGGKGKQNPIVPKIENWVRLFIIEDVKVDDLRKFEWF
ncbi:hypothetical protein NHQ30_009886 [Ciborinia camelliae]|nr:hypothetical protein NHQ30_009886 [Ciborinia camelliae]